MSMLETVAAAATGAGLIAGLALALRHRWADREIRLPRLAPPAAAFVGALVAGLLPVDDEPAVTFAMAATVSLAVIAAVTDIASEKIAKETCWALGAIGVATFLISGGPAEWGWLPYAISIAALSGVPLLGAFLTRGGLGFGDIRLMTAYALSLGWWVGPYALMWGVITACLLQGIARLVIRRARAERVPFGPALSIGIVGWVPLAFLLA